MRVHGFVLTWVLLVAAAVAQRVDGTYPPAPRSDAADTVHGIVVADPYRWLESPDAPETSAWVRGQDAALRSFVASAPGAANIHARLDALVAYDTVSVPQQAGRRYVFSKAPADRSVNVGRLYVADDAGAPGQLIVDVQADEGASAALGTFAASPDGGHVAYVVHEAGSAWGGLRVHHLRDGRTERIAQPGIHRMSRLQWTSDSRELFYTTFARAADPQAPIGRQALHRRHVTATPVNDEEVPLGIEDASRLATVGVTEDGRTAVITTPYPGLRGLAWNDVFVTSPA